MQTKYFSVLIHIRTKGEVGALWNWLKLQLNILLTFPRRCFFCGSFMFLLVFVKLFCEYVYWCLVVTCWERADLLALVCDVYCEGVTFPLVSWVSCGAILYRFLIFALFLNKKWRSLFILQEIPDLFSIYKYSNMQLYIRRWFVICMCKISAKNFIIKDILMSLWAVSSGFSQIA